MSRGYPFSFSVQGNAISKKDAEEILSKLEEVIIQAEMDEKIASK